MIFFNESNLYQSAGIMDVPATNMGIEAGEAGNYRALYESTNEWFNIREKMMKLEHHAYVTEDTMLLEAGSGGFFKKIADLFRKLLGMIKEMWNNFVKKIGAMTMKDKDFVKKYGQQLRANASKAKLKVKGYTYDGLDAQLAKIAQVANQNLNSLVKQGQDGLTNASMYGTNSHLEKVADKFDMKDEDYNKLRGALVGKGSVDAEDFAKELRDQLTGEEQEEMEVTISVVERYLNLLSSNEKELKTLETTKSTLEKCYSDSANLFDKLAANIDKHITNNKEGYASATGKAGSMAGDKGKYAGSNTELKATADKGNDQHVKAVANRAADAIRQSSSIVQSAFSTGVEVFKQRHSFARATLGKLLTAKAAKNESVEFGATTNILDQF